MASQEEGPGSQANKHKHTCSTHKNALAEFYCQIDKQLLCKKCVTAHTKHDFIFIKDTCINLAKPWSDLNNRLTRIMASLEDCKASPDDIAKAKERHEQFNRKYEAVLNMKKEQNFLELE